MSRIPEAEIEHIKLEVAIERLAVGAGVALGRQGDDLIGACPFCEAADALTISPGSNLWRCGACGVGGSVIDWVMRAEGVAFRHAVELLRDGHTPTRLDGSKPPARSSTAKLTAPFAPELSNGDLLERVVGFYHQALLESPDAHAYLAERCVADGDAVERFGVGFSNRTLGYRVPHSQRSEGKALRTRLVDLGVYRTSGHEHYSGSLVVPVRDDHGQVVQLYGRDRHPHPTRRGSCAGEDDDDHLRHRRRAARRVGQRHGFAAAGCNRPRHVSFLMHLRSLLARLSRHIEFEPPAPPATASNCTTALVFGLDPLFPEVRRTALCQGKDARTDRSASR